MNKNKIIHYLLGGIFIMGRKPKYTKEIKIQAIQEYLDGKKSVNQITNELQCSKKAFRLWLDFYHSIGESVFNEKTHNKQYTKELKLQVVNEYLNGLGSLKDLINKYKIHSESTLRKWVLLYNSGKEIKDYLPNHEVYTMKARKVAYEERIEIVNYCISHDKNYKATADKYNVPYARVYSWVKLVNTNGYESLRLQKKGPKPKYLIEPKTVDELKDIEIEKLRLENERLRIENEVLKKKHRLPKRTHTQK